ncbi:2-oxo acid dehydrogenase subunit E2 [Leucobacter ruminantium]|uniref:Dihydrolipoamide acetyltransferase component of pyruvate dehydrogenase complex n=2 Tax=Leucobacter ruminantium TaxID=1289170 RepID=A0A939LVA7_9MICO|nr:2-oxo acid dehydrogenase subunit E2 [Leucobacter ruminantium]
MATVVYMPEVLANVTEAAISTWSVQEGDSVAAGDTLAEVETEKAVVDFASEHTGVVAKLLVAAGDNVAVGAPIAVLRGDGESDADVASAVSALGDGSATAVPAAEPAPAEPAPAPSTPPAPAPVAVPAQAAPAPAAPTYAAADGERRFASPLARRLAREHGLDTAGIVGSGPSGRIVRRDIERALAERATTQAPAPASEPTPAAPAGSLAAPSGLPARTSAAHTRMRKTIARRLTESKTTVPHYYVSADCRVDALLALRAEINAGRETRISVNDLVLKAIAKALVAVPEANVMWTDEEMLSFEDVNLAVAIATESGLVTPVIRGAASLSLDAVSREARGFAEAARENRIRPEMLEGGTFTVSNLGMFGVPEFSAILNPPQAGILAVGAAIRQPVAQGDEIAIASVMRVTLSADHRAIDGAVAARLVKKFQELIEQPLSILV